MMKGNPYIVFPHLNKIKNVLVEVVKGNSIREVDNFTGVLNMIAGSEEISMIYVSLSYTSIYHTLLSGSLFNNIYILNQLGFLKINTLHLYNLGSEQIWSKFDIFVKITSIILKNSEINFKRGKHLLT
jgi:hypothetical protein